MNARRRQLEEIVLSFLLNQTTSNQISSLMEMIDYLKDSSKIYLENQVYPLLFTRIKYLKDNKCISNDQFKKLQKHEKFFNYAFGKYFKEEDTSLENFQQFLDEIMECQDYVFDNNDENNAKIIEQIHKVLNKHVDYYGVFHERFYQKANEKVRKEVLIGLKIETETLCSNIFKNGCPNVYHVLKDEKNDVKTIFRSITIILEQTDNYVEIERTVLLSMTVYAFLIQLMIDLNINIDCYKILNENKEEIKIEPVMYSERLDSVIGKNNQLILQEKYPAGNELYWKDSKLIPEIEQLFNIWANNIIQGKRVFDNINSPALDLILNQFQTQNNDTKQLCEEIEINKAKFCLLHLIIGFKESQQNKIPYLRNTQLNDFYYYLNNNQYNRNTSDALIFIGNDNKDKLETLLLFNLYSNIFDHIYIPKALKQEIDGLYTELVLYNLFDNEKRLQVLVFLYYLKNNDTKMIEKLFIDFSKYFDLDENTFHLYCSIILQHNQKSVFIIPIYSCKYVLNENIKPIALQIFKKSDDSDKGKIFTKLFQFLNDQQKTKDETNVKYLFEYIEVINTLHAKTKLDITDYSQLTQFIKKEIETILLIIQTETICKNKTENEQTLLRISNFFIFSSFDDRIQNNFDDIELVYLQLKYLLFYPNKLNDLKRIQEIKFGIYYYLSLKYQVNEYQIIKIKNDDMQFKDYFFLNCYLHFYFCDSLRNRILSSQLPNDNFHYLLFHELVYSDTFSFSIFKKICSKKYNNNAIAFIKSIVAGFIKSIPSIKDLMNEDILNQAFSSNSSIAIQELDNKKRLTIQSLLREKEFELRSVLVVINEEIPLAASYFRFDNNWFRFQTQFKEVTLNSLEKVIQAPNNKIILFYEHKSSKQIPFYSLKQFVSKNIIDYYPYAFFNLSLHNNLLTHFSEDENDYRSQVETIKQLNLEDYNDSMKHLIQKFKNYVITKRKNLQSLVEILNTKKI